MAIEGLTPEQSAFLEDFVLDAAPAAAAADKRFPALLKAAQALQARIAKLPTAAQTLLQAKTAELDTKLTQAQQQARDGNADQAADALTVAEPVMRELRRDMKLAATYATEAAKFQTRLATARSRKGGDGGIAIADYIERLETDDQRRAAAEARGDLRMALTACEAMDNIHDAKMQDADRGREFLTLKTNVETAITQIEHQAAAPETVQPLVAEIREMINDATNFTKSDNWVGAVIMMRNARTEFKVGSAALDLSQKLDAAGQDPDFDKASENTQALIGQIGGMRGANAFAGQLREASDLTASARALLPDTDAARAELDRANQLCNDVAQLILQQNRVQSVLRSTLTQHKALTGLNAEKCIQKEVKATARLIKNAAKQVTAQKFDAALDTLKQADTQIAAGIAAGQAYGSDIKSGRLAIARTMQTDPDQDIAGELKSLFAQITKSYDQRDIQTSQRLSRQAMDLCASA
jgi:hypothetical protein